MGEAFVIRSFRHKGLRDFFDSGSLAGVNHRHTDKLTRILSALDRALGPDDVRHPTFRLHPLKGARKGTWSVTVAANWRVTFAFDKSNDVVEVDYEDYH